MKQIKHMKIIYQKVKQVVAIRYTRNNGTHNVITVIKMSLIACLL